jgi:hypothetical protein
MMNPYGGPGSGTERCCEHCKKASRHLKLSNGEELLCPTCMKKHCERDDARYGRTVDATNQNDLHGASSPDPDPEPSLTVAQLDGISSTDPKDMAVVFMNSLNVIYQYGFKDIDDVLQHFSMDVLNTLHHDLCAKVSTMFPQYKDKRSVNRQAKHKAVYIRHLCSRVLKRYSQNKTPKMIERMKS